MKEAIEKLNKELEGKKEAEVFANYLKSKIETDSNLTNNILNPEKTLSGLMKEVESNARKLAKNNVAMVSSEIVFRWVENYYGNEKPEINERDIEASREIKDEVKKETKKVKKADDNQISLFEF